MRSLSNTCRDLLPCTSFSLMPKTKTALKHQRYWSVDECEVQKCKRLRLQARSCTCSLPRALPALSSVKLLVAWSSCCTDACGECWLRSAGAPSLATRPFTPSSAFLIRLVVSCRTSSRSQLQLSMSKRSCGAQRKGHTTWVASAQDAFQVQQQSGPREGMLCGARNA